jgi:hypothetical protein
MVAETQKRSDIDLQRFYPSELRVTDTISSLKRWKPSLVFLLLALFHQVAAHGSSEAAAGGSGEAREPETAERGAFFPNSRARNRRTRSVLS